MPKSEGKYVLEVGESGLHVPGQVPDDTPLPSYDDVGGDGHKGLHGSP